MNFQELIITKANGQSENFSIEKFRTSLFRAKATPEEIERVVEILQTKLYPGIKTREIYKMASQILQQKSPGNASRFGLKKAIKELGPSGFPFERFVAALFEQQGFKTEVGQTLQGKCVTHEVDVIGRKADQIMLVECKYHNRPGFTVDVKIPLYINSRFQDLLENHFSSGEHKQFTGWIATNARFSDDAISYSLCRGIQLLGWDYPRGNALKDWIDRSGLYPLTCLGSLSSAEKKYLLEKEVVLVKELENQDHWLHKAGIPEVRMNKVKNEIASLLQDN